MQWRSSSQRPGRWHQPLQSSGTACILNADLDRITTVHKQSIDFIAEDGLYAFLAEASPDAVLGITLDGVVASWNPGAASLFGYVADEAVGQPVARFVRLDTDALKHVSEGGQVPFFDTHGVAKHGVEIPISLTIAPVADDGGGITGGLVIARGSKGAGNIEQRFHQLEEITQEAWWEEDLQTGQVRNSPRFCKMLGLDDSMLSYPLSVYLARIHPDDLQRVLERFDTAMREGTEYREIYRIRHAQGHYIWVENRCRVLSRDSDGKPLRVLGALVDVTDRKQAETALRISEERYRQVAEITQEAWWEEDIELSILTNSHRFCDILGRGEEILECTVAAYRELIHPDDRNHTRAAHDRAVYEGADYKQVYRLLHANGHYVWVEDLARVIARDEQGKATRMLGAITDITARKKAQIALQESEENFRRLFDDAPDAYLIMDQSDLTILACNHAAARLLRSSRQQVIGKKPDEVSPPVQPDGRPTTEVAAEQMDQILSKGYHRFEFMHRRVDGDDFWAEVTAGVGSFRQRPVFYVTWREIGEIIAAKQAAEAASVAKTQFLSVMSHELRTPLNAIMGMFQLIEMSGVSDKVRDFAAKGLKSSDHLLQLVDDILDFSSIEAGRLALMRMPFSLSTLLDEVISAAGARRKTNIDLKVNVDPTVQTLELAGDALRLRQVLINLLGNALKFTESGSVVLSVTRAGGSEQSPLLEYSVTDTGIGLTPEQLSRLFQPFTQVDMSSVRRFSGTGLGLVISQRLIGLLGGEPIKVESQAGVGSRFAFRLALPVVRRTVAELPVTGAPVSPAGRLNGLRLLVVDDSESERFMLRLLMEAEGAIVEQADDGAQGISAILAAERPFDAVLMDMQMPNKDGLQATRELRTLGYRHPILALTANAFERDRQACLAAGMNDHVAKPAKIEELVDVVQRNRLM